MKDEKPRSCLCGGTAFLDARGRETKGSKQADMTTRKAYTTDLSDLEWQLIEPLIPGPQPLGRPMEYSRREILNAIFASLPERVRLAGFARRLPALWHRFTLLSRLAAQRAVAIHQ